MSQLWFQVLLSCVFLAGALGAPQEDKQIEANSDSYEARVKLLTGQKSLPNCKQNNDELGECLKKLFNIIMPRISAGIPELNLPPAEPLLLNSTTFQFNIGPLKGRLLIKDTALHGLSGAQVKSVDIKTDKEALKMSVHTVIPKLKIIGNYKADVSVNNNYHMKPRGTFNLTAVNIDNYMTIDGKFYEKDGHKFVRLHSVDAAPKIGNLDIDVTGVFEDPELNQLALNLAKQYWRDIYGIMLPETRDYWEPILLNGLNEALSLIPYDAFVESR